MTGFDEFIKLFGKITVLDVVELILAVVFIAFVYHKIKKFFTEKLQDEEKRKKEGAERDKKLDEVVDAVAQYPKYRQQSLDIQQKLQSQITALNDAQAEQREMIRTMDDGIRKRERNRLRERILQNYRYYTSAEHNPAQAWTRMESDAFWESFGDYEDLNGDGYVHSVVQPAMNELLVVEMDDLSEIARVMAQRK